MSSDSPSTGLHSAAREGSERLISDLLLSAEGCLFDFFLKQVHFLEQAYDNAPQNTWNERRLRASIKTLRQHGFTLRRSWPIETELPVEDWIGTRLYLVHKRRLSPRRPTATIVCSQLGRQKASEPHWPKFLDLALRDITRHQRTLFVARHTTLAQQIVKFATRSELDYVETEFAESGVSLSKWLIECAGQVHLDDFPELFISDALIGTKSPGLKPVRDVASISMIDFVYAVSIRKNGKLEKLIRRRLEDNRFPCASVYQFIHKDSRNSNCRLWLAGAVGWYVSNPPVTSKVSLFSCRTKSNTVRQLSTKLPESLLGDGESEWLVHCTRATPNQHPMESPESRDSRRWLDGHSEIDDAWTTLNRICSDHKIRASNRLTRSQVASVSLSAVPLGQLISQRAFRPHLGRWDWEPFGMMVRKSALCRMGAKPVIYGPESEYSRLKIEDKPFFQAQGNTYDWTVEREWRFLGDLNLRELSQDDVRVFVHHAWQANRITQNYPWPAFWIGETYCGAG